MKDATCCFAKPNILICINSNLYDVFSYITQKPTAKWEKLRKIRSKDTKEKSEMKEEAFVCRSAKGRYDCGCYKLLQNKKR